MKVFNTELYTRRKQFLVRCWSIKSCKECPKWDKEIEICKDPARPEGRLMAEPKEKR